MPTRISLLRQVLAFAWIACGLLVPQAFSQAPSPSGLPAGKIRVLILTGMDVSAHDWKARTQALQEILAADPRFQIGVETDPEFLAKPALFNYDVILLNFYSANKDFPGKASRDNLVKFVGTQGRGLFILHFACGNFPDWPEFNQMAGLVFTPEGRPGYHDRYQPFNVDITDSHHPVTKGLGPQLKAHDECYYCLGGATGPYDILATAHSQNTKKDHPMALTVQYGKGRTFHTPLGHDVQSIKMPDVAELIRRGLVWAATKTPSDR